MKKARKGEITRARKEADLWTKNGRGRKATMMLDTKDGSVWTDCFIDENSFKVYQADTIVEIPVGWIIQDATGDQPITAKEIDEAVYNWCNDRMAEKPKNMQDVYALVLITGFGDNYFSDLLRQLDKSEDENLTDEEYGYICKIIDMDSKNMYQ